ncbi:MAG: hypothetical protein WD844_17850 [Thermoleophilaceae bacterium]
MFDSRTPRLAPLAAILALLATAALAVAQTNGTRDSVIASPIGGGTAADGDSDNVAFSGDNRRTRYIGFDSTSTNLVSGDTNSSRDVFLIARSSQEGSLSGRMTRASVSSRGRQGNADSRLPSISGESGRSARCVAFESQATNLASGDRSRDWDVYVRDLKRRSTTLVSRGRSNARTPVVDGACEFVTFESAGRIYVYDIKSRKATRIARGTNPDQQTNGKGVAYERSGQVYYQAYLRKFRSRKRGGPYVKRSGREQLVSRSAAAARGNGVSRNPSLDDAGLYVAFESTATNLCEGGSGCAGVGSADRNGAVSDVFRRTLNSRRAPSKDYMQIVSYSQGCSAASPSAAAVDAQGDGPSNNPQMTGAGENIVFDSEATNLKESSGIAVADANGAARDVFYWNFPRGRRCGNVSRESRGSQPREAGSGQPLNGASTNPATSNRANYIGFTSTQSGDLGELNGPGIPDVFVRFLGGE